MSNRRLTTLVTTALGASLFALSVATAGPASAADDPIAIPDVALKACLNEMLGQGAADDIRPSQVSDPALQLQVSCSNRGITDLTGIEHLTGARTISLDRNNISDVTPLGALGRNFTGLGQTLSDFHIENNHVTNLSAMKDLIVRYYFFAEPQDAVLASAVRSIAVPNPLTNQDGSAIVPTSADPGFTYSAATNTFMFSTPGAKTLTWSTLLTPGSREYPETYSSSGTLTILVTLPEIPTETASATPTDTGTATQTPGPTETTAAAVAAITPLTSDTQELAATGFGVNRLGIGAGMIVLLGAGFAIIGTIHRRRTAKH